MAYKAKSSYNFETMRAKIYLSRKPSPIEEIYRWLIHGAIGVFVGTVAFCMLIVEEYFAKIHANYTQRLITDGYSLWWSYLFWSGYPLIFAFTGVVMTVYYGPYAAGSGVPEVMGMLNGVNGAGAVYVASLITKSVCTTFAVLGNLCVGKEGPLVHIGSICGLLCPYMPFEIFRCFHNDSDKRTFMAAGCSAGVAAAFGAPIGGTLFTYEISKPTTFWTFSMLWRVFFSAAMACFTLGILQSLETGAVLSLSNSAVLKFGDVYIVYSPVSDAVVAVILGTICGLLGALFVSVYSILGVYRKKYVNTNLKKVLEVLLLSLATSSAFFWLSALNASNPTHNCTPLVDEGEKEKFAFTCPEGTFNTQTTLFFNTEGGVIRSLMNQ